MAREEDPMAVWSHPTGKHRHGSGGTDDGIRSEHARPSTATRIDVDHEPIWCPVNPCLAQDEGHLALGQTA